MTGTRTADIVITEFMDEAVVADLRRNYAVHHDPELFARPDEIARLIADVPALIVRNQTQVRGELLAAGRALKVVGRLGVGLDNIDVEACEARGIKVFPATGANSLSVVEYVIGTAMVLLRGAYFANAAMIAGTFPKTKLIGREIEGRQLGLIGFGLIARDTAAKARAIGMKVAAYDPYVPADSPVWAGIERLSLDEILSASDVVSVHLPLTPETRGLLSREKLATMRHDAILVNAARGGILDEDALCDALKAGRLGGAALDVFAQEPLGAQEATRFRDVPNLILTPHIAGNTVESNTRVSSLVAQRVVEALEASS